MGTNQYNRNRIRRKSEVGKAYLAGTNQLGSSMQNFNSTDKRGINIYELSELFGVSARDKEGNLHSGTVERPVFSLSVFDRIEIFKRASMVQGVVTSRAKRISALNWKIQRKNIDFDRLISELKEYKEVYDEYADAIDLKNLVVKSQMRNAIIQKLPEVKLDMSNFNSALRRFKRKTERVEFDKATEIEEWLKNPNIHDTFECIIQKWVTDLMVHGSVGIYKEWMNKTVENFYLLPGGTVYPFRSPHVGGVSAYFQIIPGMEAKIYFDDEISFSSYVPTSWSSYGEVPLEALINKVAESLLFDRRSADQADGTKPPEKAIIFESSRPGLPSLTTDILDLPMNKSEQRRIETALNEPRQEAIKTLTGVGTPTVVDLSRADTFSAQQSRQDKLLRDVAMIYNMTNMEINLAGGEFTSGKETSDAQKEMEQEKGIAPIVRAIENIINRSILPFRFGWDWEFVFDTELSEEEQMEIILKKKNSGIYSVNELREEQNLDVFPEEQYDRPQEGGQAPPDGSEMNPLSVKGM